MSARSALRLGMAVLVLLCSRRPSLASEPDAAYSAALPAASAPDRQGAAAHTLRVLADGNRLRILREEHTGTATLATLNLPAPARDAPLLLGRAAYLPLEGTGVVVVDIGVPEDPYIVWQLAKDRIITSLSVSQDRLLLESLQQPLAYDVADPLRPRGREITKAAARRFYGASGSGRDAEGLPLFAAEAPSGRRLRLKSGEILLGHLHSQGAGRFLLCPTDANQAARADAAPSARAAASPQPCQGRTVSLPDILRLDAVYLDEAAPEDVAPPIRSQPSVSPAISRQPEGAQPPDVQVLSALLDGSTGPLLYRPRGSRFEVLRRTGRDEVLLGFVDLPQPARSSALTVGSAAYVLLQQGVAVVDIALARYPYVAWILEPATEIQRMQIQHGTLILQTPSGPARYNLALPLLPNGPNRQAVHWRRHADSSATAADASWVERTEASVPAARRLFLRGGAAELVWDFRCSADSERCDFRRRGLADSAPFAEIEHVEAVHAVAGATSTAAVAPEPATPEPREPPPSQWTHLTGTSGLRVVPSPARVAGIVIAGVGGGVALVSGVAFLVLNLPIPVGGGVPLGDGSSKIPLAVSAGVGLGVGIVGGIIAIAGGNKMVQVPARN